MTSKIQTDADVSQRVQSLLKTHPLVDGHNDWVWQLRKFYGENWWALDLNADARNFVPPLHTDIPRLREGGVAGQFWAAWIPPKITGPAAIQATLEQIDIVHGIALRYPETFEIATTSADVRRIKANGKIASLIGIEGGHQIGNSLPALRQFFALGARYMTLTHVQHTDWADCANLPPKHHGLTDFGLVVVDEMNRLGMLIDLSHVSADVMHMAIERSKAPVIFSHSGVRALVDHPRNVADDVLAKLPANGGLVMVIFYPVYISQARFEWEALRVGEEARCAELFCRQTERIESALESWLVSNPEPQTQISDVADHLEHVVKIAGFDHVGLGSDFDGIEVTPIGLSGVNGFPALLRELMHRGWNDENLAKLMGANVMRALDDAAKIAKGLNANFPTTLTITDFTTIRP
jgi:membrane dipeptidase